MHLNIILFQFDLLTIWEIFLPKGQVGIHENNHVHDVKSTQRKGCCIRLLISCLR
jgi:hypothetical protein